MSGGAIDVSIVVFAHDQDDALHGTMESVRRTSAHASAAGWQIEQIVVAGAECSHATREQLDALGPAWSTTTAGRGRGGQRRAGVHASRGRFVAMLDAPDMWGETFVTRAIELAEAGGSMQAVWRPEAVVSIGTHFYFDLASHRAFWQPDTSGNYDPASLLFACPFATTFMAPRALLQEVPFPDEDPARGWEDADWWWTCNVAGQGAAHRIVPATFCYERDIAGRATPLAGRAAGRPGPGPLARRQRG